MSYKTIRGPSQLYEAPRTSLEARPISQPLFERTERGGRVNEVSRALPQRGGVCVYVSSCFHVFS